MNVDKEKKKEYDNERRKIPEIIAKQKIADKKYKEKNRKLLSLRAKEYNQDPKNKERIKIYQKEYMKQYTKKNKEKLKLKNKIWRENNKEKIKEYDRKRSQYPERILQEKIRNKKPKRVAYKKSYHKKYQVERRKVDEDFRLKHNLRTHFSKALNLYSKKGKIMSSKKYGIDWGNIIKHLGPVPQDGNTYEADHIIPLSMFDHDDALQVKKAWAPENFQWLTKEINQWKGDRLIKPLTEDEKIKLQKELIE